MAVATMPGAQSLLAGPASASFSTSSSSCSSLTLGCGALRQASKLALSATGASRSGRTTFSCAAGGSQQDAEADLREGVAISRRAAVGLAAVGAALVAAGGDRAVAVPSGSLAGRIPGLSEPDSDGVRTYKRPAGKSGGHGVGWSELIPYSFKVPAEGWQEVPVSIADLGGTEIDLRFSSSVEGNISVVVAPVLRFSDRLGDNAKIEDIGSPDKVIYAFGPELTGGTVEGKVQNVSVKEKAGRTYYEYSLDPHILVSATAAGNRLYIMTVSASGRQWKKFSDDLKNIADSFYVG